MSEWQIAAIVFGGIAVIAGLFCLETGFSWREYRGNFIFVGLVAMFITGVGAVFEGSSTWTGCMLFSLGYAFLAWLSPYVLSFFADREETPEDTPKG